MLVSTNKLVGIEIGDNNKENSGSEKPLGVEIEVITLILTMTYLIYVKKASKNMSELARVTHFMGLSKRWDY